MKSVGCTNITPFKKKEESMVNILYIIIIIFFQFSLFNNFFIILD
jgi:hypothetical protein